MEVGIGKGVRDPKGHAMACHECNNSFLLKPEVTSCLFKIFYTNCLWDFLGHRKASIEDAHLSLHFSKVYIVF